MTDYFRYFERQDAEVIAKALNTIVDPTGETDREAANLYRSLPGLCCKSLGGNPEGAEKVASAWEILYLAAYLLDAVADEGKLIKDPGLLVTISVSCIPVAHMLLDELTQVGLSDEKQCEILTDFDRAILRVCIGQVKDLTEKEPSLEKCWEIAGEKTGEIFALAARNGARLASNSPDVLARFSDFGKHLGILVQIGDDIRGLWQQNNTRSDIAAGKWTLPVSYGMQVLSPAEQETLRWHLDQAGEDRAMEAAARRMLIEAGGLLYLAAEADRNRQLALKALTEAVPQTGCLQELLDFISRGTAWIYAYEGKVS